MTLMDEYIALLVQFGLRMNLHGTTAIAIAETLAFLSIVVVGIIVYFIAKLIIKKVIYPIIRRTSSQYDDLLIKNKVLTRLCLLIPIIIVKAYARQTLPDYQGTADMMLTLASILEVLIIARTLVSTVNFGKDIYNSHEMAKDKPITGLTQVVNIIIYCVCTLIIFSLLLHKEISALLIGLGTISALLLLIFQNTILGFVGSIQLSVNDMLRIGDWIVVGDADGTVTEINLTTVKVQNWDNTITTIPTYTLVANQFTNWRGMSESGGRRIMRSINIDIDSIKFCTPEMLERFKKIELISEYIALKQKEIDKYNNQNHCDTSLAINGRQQTNIGIFRIYLLEYLKQNKNINQNLSMFVRQLQPTENGLPVQIYVFSNKTDLTEYEEVQSDLFDHVISSVKMFDLRIFQKPTSYKVDTSAKTNNTQI